MFRDIIKTRLRDGLGAYRLEEGLEEVWPKNFRQQDRECI
jgi:hypothetical protein